MQKVKLVCVVLFSILVTSCINNVEDQAGGNDINPEDISYSANVQPIFNASCGGGSCHISNSTNNVNLSSYTNAVNSTGIQCGTIIVPGEPENSPLIDKIEPNPECGLNRMPQTGSPLSAAQIDTIRAWIEGGALNN